MNRVCKICGNEAGNSLHKVREMGFGLRESFDYLECAQCGCLQIVDVPRDMAKYYPPGYYSLHPHGKLKELVRQRWAAHAFGENNVLGWAVAQLFFPHRPMLAVARVNPPKTARILDVGCGRGYLLQDLARLGYVELRGADPFVERDLTYPNGVKVFKRDLSQIEGTFDLIMLHHSFEHMSEPATVMREVAAHLSAQGRVILGIPVASSFAWREYGVNWVNLDAPRHFFLHTFKSIDILVKQAGLVVETVVHEGNDEQFWASEQYAKDIPSNDPRSIGSNPLKRLLASPRIRSLRARAQALNEKGEGDLVCFHLTKRV